MNYYSLRITSYCVTQNLMEAVTKASLKLSQNLAKIVTKILQTLSWKYGINYYPIITKIITKMW